MRKNVFRISIRDQFVSRKVHNFDFKTLIFQTSEAHKQLKVVRIKKLFDQSSSGFICLHCVNRTIKSLPMLPTLNTHVPPQHNSIWTFLFKFFIGFSNFHNVKLNLKGHSNGTFTRVGWSKVFKFCPKRQKDYQKRVKL